MRKYYTLVSWENLEKKAQFTFKTNGLTGEFWQMENYW